MTLCGRGLVGALGVMALIACRTAQPPLVPASTGQAVNRTENPCLKPLEKACSNGRCPTLEEAKAEVKASIKQRGGRCSFAADAGTCGDYQYVRSENSIGSRISYFDRTGKLVGVKGTQDAMYEPCFGTFRYGKEIDCSFVVQENYCRQ